MEAVEEKKTKILQQDSNQGPPDYYPSALPTEPSSHDEKKESIAHFILNVYYIITLHFRDLEF